MKSRGCVHTFQVAVRPTGADLTGSVSLADARRAVMCARVRLKHAREKDPP